MFSDLQSTYASELPYFLGCNVLQMKLGTSFGAFLDPVADKVFSCLLV